jgi:hypothetical protein
LGDPAGRDGTELTPTPSNGRAAEQSAKNGKSASGKVSNGKATNGKPANGNIKSNGNTATARIVALRIVDGVPIHSDHDLAGQMAGNGNGVASPSGSKRRNGSANGKTIAAGKAKNGNGSPHAEGSSPAFDLAAIKQDLLRRPARRSNGEADGKSNGKAIKKA